MRFVHEAGSILEDRMAGMNRADFENVTGAILLCSVDGCQNPAVTKRAKVSRFKYCETHSKRG